jgi:hypothetical protein
MSFILNLSFCFEIGIMTQKSLHFTKKNHILEKPYIIIYPVLGGY